MASGAVTLSLGVAFMPAVAEANLQQTGMEEFMKRVTILGLAALAATAATAQTPAPQAMRTVQFELREDGRLIGAPTLQVQVGRPTAVTVGGAYSVRLRLDAEPDTDGDGVSPLVIRSTLFRPGDSARVTAPAMTVVQGMPARIQLASASGGDLSIGVLVQ